MSSHRTLPKGRPSMDAFHADLIAARGAVKRVLAIIDYVGSRGRADAVMLLEASSIAGMVQRSMRRLADDIEEDADE